MCLLASTHTQFQSVQAVQQQAEAMSRLLLFSLVSIEPAISIPANLAWETHFPVTPSQGGTALRPTDLRAPTLLQTSSTAAGLLL